MRLQFATMALGLAMLTRQIQIRSVTAFQVGSSLTLRSSSSTSTGTTTRSSIRRRRPIPSTDSLFHLVQERSDAMGGHLNLSAVQEDQTTDDISKLFPQAGQNIEDVAPRMRFAPSPTGRYEYYYIYIGICINYISFFQSNIYFFL
jgi:hypothetical protein